MSHTKKNLSLKKYELYFYSNSKILKCYYDIKNIF